MISPKYTENDKEVYSIYSKMGMQQTQLWEAERTSWLFDIFILSLLKFCCILP